VSAIRRTGTIEVVSTTADPSCVSGHIVMCTAAIDWSTKAVGGGTCVSVARTADIERRTGEFRDATGQLAAATGVSGDGADASRAFANDVLVSTNGDHRRAGEVSQTSCEWLVK
jgi:hypothetical protein